MVIAGMGGETIIAILEGAAWTKDGAHTLLLQPMTKAADLRYWLAVNGYSFTEERLVWDKNYLYPVLRVTGSGTPQALTERQALTGVALDNDPLYREYLTQQADKLRRTAEGLRRSAKAGRAAAGGRCRSAGAGDRGKEGHTMTTVREIESFLYGWAPRELAESWDNVGLLVAIRRPPWAGAGGAGHNAAGGGGSAGARVPADRGAPPGDELRVAPVQTVRADDRQGRTLTALLRGGVAAYACTRIWTRRRAASTTFWRKSWD